MFHTSYLNQVTNAQMAEFCKVDQQFKQKQKQKKNFDRRHRTSELPTFEEELVFVATD